MHSPASTALPLAGEPALSAATPEDQPFLRALYRTTREAELAGAPWTETQKAAFCDMQFNAQTAGYRQSFPGADYLVIRAPGGAQAGRLIKARLRDALLLVDIALLPAYRRQGWGGQLIGALQREAAAAGLPLKLTVEKHNPALALYRRLGFAVTGEDEIRFTMAWTS